MTARNLFRKLFQQPAAPRRARATALTLGILEAREVPAAYAFSAGTLTVNMAEVPNHILFKLEAFSSGVVRVNGADTGSSPANTVVGAPHGRLLSADVHKIVVNGSIYDDRIDLSGVDTRGFAGLNGKVEVYGNGGNDRIVGTAFGDQIHGGSGNDYIDGVGGDDRIWGDDGNDTLYGNQGNDRIDGGAGDDYLNGGDDNDLLVGGAGKDLFDGGPGTDTVWVDAADLGRWYNAEVIRTGTPPQI